MKLFGENSNSVIHNYSVEFEKCFLDLMRRKYFSKMVSINKFSLNKFIFIMKKKINTKIKKLFLFIEFIWIIYQISFICT